MKYLLITILLIVCLGKSDAYSQESTHNAEKISLFSSELEKLTVNERREMLEQQHKIVYELPYTKDYIYNHVFPELYEHRPHLAPHFPVRSESIETDKLNMEEWLKNYPGELASYLLFVSEKIEAYQKLKQ